MKKLSRYAFNVKEDLGADSAEPREREYFITGATPQKAQVSLPLRTQQTHEHRLRVWLFVGLPPGTKLVVDSDIHQLNVSVVAGEYIASDWARKTKGLVVQPNKIVLKPGGPIGPERPFEAEACGPTRIAAVGGNGGRQATDCHCRIA